MMELLGLTDSNYLATGRYDTRCKCKLGTITVLHYYLGGSILVHLLLPVTVAAYTKNTLGAGSPQHSYNHSFLTLYLSHLINVERVKK
jgi:hypothetical protein